MARACLNAPDQGMAFRVYWRPGGESLPFPRLRFGHVYSHIRVPRPSGGFAVHIGSPADLSSDARREQHLPVDKSLPWGRVKHNP
jgi:hypothetical protein